jgi:hypothetical protein
MASSSAEPVFSGAIYTMGTASNTKINSAGTIDVKTAGGVVIFLILAKSQQRTGGSE